LAKLFHDPSGAHCLFHKNTPSIFEFDGVEMLECEESSAKRSWLDVATMAALCPGGSLRCMACNGAR
jgi:hypothetical protein